MENIYFQKIFYGEHDFSHLENIFEEIKHCGQIKESDHATLMNIMFNTTIITYVQELVLNDISELLLKEEIIDYVTKKEIWEIYENIIKSNSDGIICDDFENYFDGTKLDSRGRLVVDHMQVISDYGHYFIKIRQQIFADAMKMFRKIYSELCKNLILAFNESKNITDCDITDYETLAEKYKCNINEFGIIIEFLPLYKFCENEFRDKFLNWSLNRSLSIIDFQTQYILAIIPRNKNYDKNRREFLQCVKLYEKEMNAINRKNKQDKKNIKQLYEKYYQADNFTYEDL
jgi:hypothetical protein